VLRSALLYLSHQPRVFTFVRRNGLARQFARRFVAGETADEAIAVARALNSKDITASLDLLGESVRTEAEARAAGESYVDLLRRIHASGADANVSLKLTQMGLDIGEDLCVAVTSQVLQQAAELRTFVRLDMESSAYTQRTLDLFEQRLHPKYRTNVGIVLQSSLRRTRDDVERAVSLQARVRLCKGAYLEPPSVAFPGKKDVDANFVACMQILIARGNYPAIATHDERIITETKRFAHENRITPDRFEFQMLYGVRRDLQVALVRDGWRLRVYVPFGTQWYPYLMRRLAERPANIAFITGNVVREAFRRRRRPTLR
jgi:proline dehydrogenase